MKTAQKTLGQVAYEAFQAADRPWSSMREFERDRWETVAAEVVKESRARARRLLTVGGE
jgi:hypothetical protein